MLLFKFFNLIIVFLKFNLHKSRKKPGNRIGIARLFLRGSIQVWGRSVHGLAAIAKAADVLVDFTHDMQLHPLAYMAALGTHKQTVLYHTAKLRTFPAHDAEDLMFKEKLPVGGILHVRGHSYIFHTLIFLKVLRWRCGWGSPPLPSVLLGAWKKMCRMVSPAHAFCSAFRRLFRFRVSPFSGR